MTIPVTTHSGVLGGHSLYQMVEPLSITEARREFNRSVDQIVHKFVNESVRADALGAAAIEAGNYVTLEDLERLINEE